MSNGERVRITRNTSNHGLQIGSIVYVMNVTDDELKVWDGAKFFWVNEDDCEILNSKQNDKIDV